jgi:hypothetical protein
MHRTNSSRMGHRYKCEMEVDQAEDVRNISSLLGVLGGLIPASATPTAPLSFAFNLNEYVHSFFAKVGNGSLADIV